jgi:3-deoxy-7-phosphoheptulonate synthase
VVKGLSHLPILVDPSHAGGRRALVPSLSRAAVAAGADGVMIDVHPAPESAQVDGGQALLPEEFAILMGEIRAVAAAVNRRV